VKIDLPEDADEDETAAIVAVLNAYVGMQVRAAAESAGEEGWNPRRWSFAGRVRGVGRRTVRVPGGAPNDAWTASGRLRRMR
jgi:hypothetical protein